MDHALIAPSGRRKEPRIPAQTRTLRVASIPAAHPYVRAITDSERVSVLPDPPVPGAPDGQWWPPVALTSEWLLAHAEDFDVLHVHFGIESFTSAELRASLATARHLARPVVYTVHDLENPQLTHQEPYRELLDILIPEADRLLTLTPGAAAEIAERWGRESRVVPHPTLLGHAPSAFERDEAVTRVGIHLRDLRPNLAAGQVVRVAADAATLLAGSAGRVEFDVLLNERVRDDAAATRIMEAADESPTVSVRRTERLSDAEIEAWIAGLDLFVLPYAHGTHSGWAEICFDLGVPVAGTAVGHIGEQHPSEFLSIDLDDARSLASAVRAAAGRREPSTQRAARLAQRHAGRLAEREAVRAAHAELYAETRGRS